MDIECSKNACIFEDGAKCPRPLLFLTERFNFNPSLDK